jgi:outer membrane protein
MPLRGMMLKSVLGFAIALGTGHAAVAQQAPDGFTVGALGITGTSPYVGQDRVGVVVPLLGFKRGTFSMNTGKGASLGLITRDGLDVAAIIAPRFTPFNADDSAALAGMNRNFSVDGGVTLGFAATDRINIDLRAVTEVTGEHGGQEVSVEASSLITLGRVPMLLSGGAVWQSADLAEYVYGVRGSEAAAGRPAYAPGAAVVPFVTLGTMYPINDQTRVFGGVKAEFLPQAVTGSPIIDESVVTSLTLGVSFGF